ncbi:peptidase [Caulobacter vibrioides]|uniref:Peptidase n=1 Tax=Caulobacter vibrioides TaxID=155892 RepID=A0A290MQ15_CAUVI|nr:prohead protease/major capsid protein fusion protein [Caulobacter vibrioides]ATC34101.1 peptidase [Caulobacter vibrioides]
MALPAKGKGKVRKQTQLQTQRRDAVASTYDPENHTIELTAATSTRVLRYSWDFGPYWEELDMTPQALDARRLDAGQVPLLDTHARWTIDDQLGDIVAHRFDAEGLVTTAKFGQVTERSKNAEARAAAREIKGVSIGYNPKRMVRTGEEDGVPIFLVTLWELTEVTLCPVPADPVSGVRSAEDIHPCIIDMETRDMDPEDENQAGDPATTAETRTPSPAPTGETRAAPSAPLVIDQGAQPGANAVRMDAVQALTFAEQARSFGIDDGQVRTWVTTLSPDAARSALLNAAAERQKTDAPLTPAMSGARITVDERDTMRSAIEGALMYRYEPERYEPKGAAREWIGMSLLEMARANFERNGDRSVRGMNKRQLANHVFERQHTTSDFPSVLSNVANKTLRAGYEASPQTFRAWQRRATAPDFKQITRLQMGGAPSFLLVPEGGQFKMGTIGEGKEVYALATYGRIFTISRQVLINDDVDAFTRIPTMFGRACADFESDAAYAPLIANPNMGDGVALFHASHGNLAGSGALPGETTWQAAETAFGAQVGIEGRLINILPAHMIVATKDRVPALKLRGSTVSQAAGATPGTTNVYENGFNVVVEARLGRGAAATPWFAAANYNQVDTIEYCYLEGDNGVYLEEKQGFEVDGIQMKARTDFAVKAIDHRGLYMNPGVAPN